MFNSKLISREVWNVQWSQYVKQKIVDKWKKDEMKEMMKETG